MLKNFIIAIIGGGLAGASVATRLAAAPFHDLQIVLIEVRTRAMQLVRDRTWCYWKTEATMNAAEHRFVEISVCGRAMHRLKSSYPHEMFASDVFFRSAQLALYKAINVEQSCGVSVESFRKCPFNIEIDTSDAVVSAAHVFDSRPVKIAPAKLPGNAFLQHFKGWEITVTYPVFAPSTATLIDFRVTQTATEGVHFMYVLPTSPTQALIEDTWFTPAARMADPDYVRPDYAAHIRAYLVAKFGCHDGYTTVTYREAAVLPMVAGLHVAHLASNMPQVIPIGAAAGMARASSGYAFSDKQRATIASAETLLEQLRADPSRAFLNQPLFFEPWRAPLLDWMNCIFLTMVARYAARAPQIFESLFRNVPADRLARFLGGVLTYVDLMYVIAACPKWLFITSAVANIVGKVR